MDIKFEEVIWATDNFHSPFLEQHKNAELERPSNEGFDQVSKTFCALARKMCLTESQLTRIHFDARDDSPLDSLLCVVIGWDRNSAEEVFPSAYALVVRRVGLTFPEAYERVGVVTLTSANFDAEGVWVRIQ